MKEHPDYKYRPRRKPKSLIKKENKFGFTLSPLMSSNDTLSGISRGLLPPLSAPPAHHSLLNHDDLKIPRFFPSFPYSLYPIQHKMTTDNLNSSSGSKLAADLTFQAIYGGGTFYASHHAVTATTWPTLSSSPTCLQNNCNCPSQSPTRGSPKDMKRSLNYLPQISNKSSANNDECCLYTNQNSDKSIIDIEDDKCQRDDIYIKKNNDKTIIDNNIINNNNDNNSIMPIFSVVSSSSSSMGDKNDGIKMEDSYSLMLSTTATTTTTTTTTTSTENTSSFSVQSLTSTTTPTSRNHVI